MYRSIYLSIESMTSSLMSKSKLEKLAKPDGDGDNTGHAVLVVG